MEKENCEDYFDSVLFIKDIRVFTVKEMKDLIESKVKRDS